FIKYSYDIDKLKFLHLEGGGLYHLMESKTIKTASKT
ncbi:hypothetical protein N500_0364, partial [Wolbachia pipientis wUni]